MKKAILNPLELDKKTIALLDATQLQAVTGGAAGVGITAPSSSSGGGGSTGCGSGSSQCRVLSGN
jgi:hypothetical protein